MFSSQGQIQLIIGPMFSGKSSELMRLVKRFTIAERECLVLNYAMDNRFGNEGQISTHDHQHFRAIKLKNLSDIYDETDKYDVIAIDEGQFFPDIAQFCEDLANKGKVVLVAALDGTFERKPFSKILELIPLCEKVVKLTAVCWYCKQDNASFTKRTVQSKEIELIGGEEMYRPACRQCFFKDPNTLPLTRDKQNKENLYQNGITLSRKTHKKEKEINNHKINDPSVSEFVTP